MKKWILLVFVMVVAGLAFGAWFLMANSRIEEVRNLEGITEKYYWFGRLVGERNYLNQKLNGLTRTFYGDGTVKSEWTYRDGILEGMARHYDVDGKLKAEEFFEGGQKVWKKTYDVKGNLIATEEFGRD